MSDATSFPRSFGASESASSSTLDASAMKRTTAGLPPRRGRTSGCTVRAASALPRQTAAPLMHSRAPARARSSPPRRSADRYDQSTKHTMTKIETVESDDSRID